MNIGGVAFTSNVMPAGGGRLALSMSKSMPAAAGAAVGQPAEVVIEQAASRPRGDQR